MNWSTRKNHEIHGSQLPSFLPSMTPTPLARSTPCERHLGKTPSRCPSSASPPSCRCPSRPVDRTRGVRGRGRRGRVDRAARPWRASGPRDACPSRLERGVWDGRGVGGGVGGAWIVHIMVILTSRFDRFPAWCCQGLWFFFLGSNYGVFWCLVCFTSRGVRGY